MDTDPVAEFEPELLADLEYRHPLETRVEQLEEVLFLPRMGQSLAEGALRRPIRWAESSDLGGEALAPLVELRRLVISETEPDYWVVADLRSRVAGCGAPEHVWWDLYLACALTGERAACLEVARGWGEITERLSTLLQSVGHRHLVGMAKGRRQDLETRREIAAATTVGWAVAAGREDGRDPDYAKSSVAPPALRFAQDLEARLFLAVRGQAYDQGYADGAAAAAKADGRLVDERSPRARRFGLAGLDRHHELSQILGGSKAKKPGIPRLVVVPPLSEVSKKELGAAFKALSGAALTLAACPPLAPVRTALLGEFPHAGPAVDALLADLTEGAPLRFRPTVVVGDPGAGKSRLVRRFLKLVGLPFGVLDAATTLDHALTGSPKRWHSAYPSLPLTLVERHSIANPAVVLDELEKAGRSTAGSMHDPLLSLLEPLTSQSWRDQFLDAEVNLSAVNWLATANSLSGIPGPLLNRLRVLRVEAPRREHLPVLAASVLAEVLRERGVDPRFEPSLDGEELAAVGEAWGEAGSIRTLRRFVEGVLDARRTLAPRN